MSDAIIERFMRRVALATGRARTCIRQGQIAEAKQHKTKAENLLSLCAQARLVRACAVIESQSSK